MTLNPNLDAAHVALSPRDLPSLMKDHKTDKIREKKKVSNSKEHMPRLGILLRRPRRCVVNPVQASQIPLKHFLNLGNLQQLLQIDLDAIKRS